MMLLSRFWYVILALATGVSLYIVFLAVGQYNRQNVLMMNEGLASDSQTVEFALKIDSRRRLDRLLIGSSDRTLGDALTAAYGKDTKDIPQKSKDDAKKSLAAVMDQIQPEFRPDMIFGVDRQGRVIGAAGTDPIVAAIAQNSDFELGGYPAVFDALHGFLRDDTWAWGGRLYMISSRPVEITAGEAPAGAIVGLKEINKPYATDMAKKTRTNLAFYSAGTDGHVKPVSFATGVKDFSENQLEQIGSDLDKLTDDKDYSASGHSDVRMLTPGLGARYARINGDAWDQQAGFAVLRGNVALTGPLGFLSGADDADKKSVPLLSIIVPVILLGILLGIGFTVIEHSLPLSELAKQAQGMKEGKQDGLQVARFRGAYRLAAQNLNLGTERIIEKGGGVPRKAADLESILGPVPAQPAMSAFQFPLQPGQQADGSSQAPSLPQQVPNAPPSVPGRAPPSAPGGMGRPTPAIPIAIGGNTAPNAFTPPAKPGAMPQRPPPVQQMGPPPALNAPPPPMAAPAGPMRPPTAPVGMAPPARPQGPPPPPPAPMGPMGPMGRIGGEDQDDEDATMVAAIPAEVLAQATGENRTSANAESAEWLSVYEDFIRTKKQCSEATEGLTFEKFSHTLKKNRDALMQRHACRRVRFSVYVKEGRASLKATPVKD